MAIVNNVDTEKAGQFREKVEKDPEVGRKTQVIEGEWLLEGPVQFRSDIKFEGGETAFEMTMPSFAGGTGTMPGPMHYCFFGLMGCYASTYVAQATALGVKLKKLAVHVEADINFGASMGLVEGPIMEEVRITLQVAADAPEEALRKAEELALERCPVVYTMRHEVSFKPSLKIVKA